MTNEHIIQCATVKIKCKDETGTALLYSPGESLDYMYILTAKHCLAGKEFDQEYVNTDIAIEKIYNPSTSTWHSCPIVATDKVICSESNELDLAIIIIPKARIERMSGISYPFQVVDQPSETGDCIIRGFADFNSGEADRPYELSFSETVKDKPEILVLNFDGSLDTRYQSAVSNVQGLSGSGLFTIIKEVPFLLGSIHTYEEKNRFFATKITTFNYLLPDNYVSFSPVKPEENDDVIKTFNLIKINKEAIKVRARDKVGQVHIERQIDDARTLLEKERMVVFHGQAGVGKSALAKALIEEFESSPDNIVIAFTAEQLFHPTLNEALVNTNYSADVNQIIGSSLSRRKIVFWIESFEKLVEAGFGGAFGELLSLIKTNRRLSLVVTIRSFFLQKFKIFFQFELPSVDGFYQVQDFSDEEISQIRHEIPDLEPLLDNPKLKHLLHTPYYLDKAVRIYPQLLKVDNLDEIEFKRLMWEEIVEAGDRNRGITFASIALNRARSMELFTFHEPDNVTDALISDNILQVEQSELRNRFSPSHDIVEDWALIRYIKQQKQEAETSQLFLEKLDTGPAIRRAFRLWLDDYYRQYPAAADDFSSEILLSPKVAQSWKDELVVFILSSENAYPLFSSLKDRLLENDGALLARFIHLLKTSCKGLKTGAMDFDDLVPVGSGWDALIDFVANNKDKIVGIAALEYPVLNTIFDWSKQLPDYNPQSLPIAARSCALLLLDHVHKFQSQFTSYRRSANSLDTWTQALRLVFKLTSVANIEIRQLLDAVVEFPNLRSTHWTNANLLLFVRNCLVDGVVSDQVCKYFPDIVIGLSLDKWKEKPKPAGSLMRSIKVQHGPDYWGLDDSLDHYYEAASAYQTFFYWMFLYHPEKAVLFLNTFLNEAFKKNQEGRPRGGVEWQEIELEFDNVGTVNYYGSQDYWDLFRGHSAFHAVIQSILMALEKGMLDLAEKGEENFAKLSQIIKDLMVGTNNVSVLAVIASVIQAYPKLLDENSILLLSKREIFEWDGTRFSHDMIPAMRYYGTNPFLAKERNSSNVRKHRLTYFRGLIGFVSNYMFSFQTLNQKLFEQVDAMWETATDVFWRKALFDMDARKWELKPVEVPGYENYVKIEPHYDSEVAAAVDSYKAEELPNIGLIWASNVFEGKPVDDRTYNTWKKGFEQLAKPSSGLGFMKAPGIMACIGIRDYLDQLEPKEKEWCKNQIIGQAKGMLKKDPNDFLSMDSLHFDKNAVMFAVPLLFQLFEDESTEREVMDLVVRLLFSNIENETRHYLLLSISENLWITRPQFALNCWLALFKLMERESPNMISEDMEDGDWEDYETPRIVPQDDNGEWREALITEVISDKSLKVSSLVPTLEYRTRWLLDDAIRMLPVDTNLNIHTKFIQAVLDVHLANLGRLRENQRDDFQESRDVFKFFYARYLLSRDDDQLAKLFKILLDRTILQLDNVNNFKIIEYIYAIIKQIISAINNWPTLTQPIEKFWFLWTLLRDWIVETKRSYLIPLLLLDLGWNETCDDWHVLEGRKSFFKDFILVYGANYINISIDLLSGVGFKTFMPEAVTWVAHMLCSNLAYQTKSDRLEKFIHRAFFRFGKEIKGDKWLSQNFLFILDFLIERGSPKAYMLREEMIQYK
jgi:hypothetical protein